MRGAAVRGGAGAARPASGRPGAAPVHPFVPQTEDALPLELQRFDRDHVLHRMGLHGHRFFELIYVEKAGGFHRVGQATYPARAGTVFVIPPGELHDCSAIGPEIAGWVLLFTHEALDGLAAQSRAYATAWPSSHPLLSPFLAFGRDAAAPALVPRGERRVWSQRFAALEREFAVRPAGHRLAVFSLFNMVLLDLLRLTGGQAAFVPDPLDGSLSDAFAFIDRRFHQPITTVDVARAVGRTAPHLTTSMRRRTGLTAGEWITERRMAEARRLLAATGLDLDQIADRIGYSDRGSLVRAFRRAHLLTPAAWRQAHRGHPPYI